MITSALTVDIPTQVKNETNSICSSNECADIESPIDNDEYDALDDDDCHGIGNLKQPDPYHSSLREELKDFSAEPTKMPAPSCLLPVSSEKRTENSFRRTNSSNAKGCSNKDQHRSIFSRYWKTDPKPDCKNMRQQSAVTSSSSLSSLSLSSTSFSSLQQAARTAENPPIRRKGNDGYDINAGVTRRNIIQHFGGGKHQKDDNPSKTNSQRRIKDPKERSTPGRVRRKPNNTYSYLHDIDPYEYFGIENDLSNETTNKGCGRVVEGRILSRGSPLSILSDDCLYSLPSNCSRRQLIPSVAMESGSNLLGERCTTQSDTALFSNASARRMSSCLRKSRFSFEPATLNGTGSPQTASSSSTVGCTDTPLASKKSLSKMSTASDATETTSASSSSTVSFESKIQVYLYQNHIEEWASNGWSNWFG